jgi:lysyl-tRNA synthetase class 2
MKTVKNWQKLHSEQQLLQNLRVREAVIDAIRAHFKSEGFLEVDTPLLVASPGTEVYLEVFETQLRLSAHEPLRGFLTTSPELNMKKLLAGGSGSIFQICKSFRNGEGLGERHNPEFMILEWYRVDADYTDVMRDCEEMLHAIFAYLADKKLLSKGSKYSEAGAPILSFHGKEYDLGMPWERISIAEAFEKYAGVGVDEMLDEARIVQRAREKGYAVTEQTTWEEAYNQIMLNEIEPHLGEDRPTILYDYPASQAALSKRKASDPRFAERFEFYLAGLELGNAFSELTDGFEQEERMRADLLERKKLGKVEYAMDTDFIDALKSSMPETGGIAVGVDRLIMLFADAPSVRDTLGFPVEDVFADALSTAADR